MRRRLIAGMVLCTAWSLTLMTSASALAEDVATPEKDRNELRDFLRTTIADASSFEDRFDAEVWLLDMSQRLKPFVDSPQDRLQILRQVHHFARASELPPELVLAVIEVESHFDRFAVSRVGAQGLMQVMPFWRAEIGRESDNLTNNATNLNYGCRILQFYLQKSKGSLLNALKRYNGASNLKYSRKVEHAWRERWSTAELEWN